MFFSFFIFLFVCGVVKCHAAREPKFQVLTPNELMVELPQQPLRENREVVTFRIGIRRRGHDDEDVELGENNIDKNRIFFYDKKLNLKKGDVVNYLLAFRDIRNGYQAQTGKYVFDGVYYKVRRHRREITSSTTPTSKSNMEDFDFEPTDPEVETRFGGGPRHRPRHGGWPPRGNPGFNPFGPRHPPPFGPHFPNRTPPYGPPNFTPDCNDPRREPGRDIERWERTTIRTISLDHDIDYHCGICDKLKGQSEKSSTTSDPDIDIRFAD